MRNSSWETEFSHLQTLRTLLCLSNTSLPASLFNFITISKASFSIKNHLVLLPTKINSIQFSISSSQNSFQGCASQSPANCIGQRQQRRGTEVHIWSPSFVAHCASVLPKASLSSESINQTHLPNIKASSFCHRRSI